MPSLYVHPNSSSEPRFCLFIINSYYTKSKRLQSLDFLFYLYSGDFPSSHYYHERVTFSKLYHHAKACNFTKSNTPPWVFFTFFKFTNDTKLRNASHIYKSCLLFHHTRSFKKDLERSLPVSFVIPIVSLALEIIN